MMKLADILLEIKHDYKIYCDLDGVLVDFVKGYKKLTGKNPPKAETQTDKRAFWEEVDKAGSKFWADLEWRSDGKVLWNYLKKYDPEILSSPSDSKTSKEGKKDWMDKYLPDIKLNLEQSKSKQKYAKPNRILIDDRADICQKWESAGGIAIHHTTANRTIKELQKIMSKKPINEAKQVGKLYHFTSYKHMIEIVKSNFVLTTHMKDIQPYVSFTRGKSMYSDSISQDVRITIDGTALSNKYKITPHADTRAGYGRGSVDEFEERISLEKYPEGVDISKYILAIDIKKPVATYDYDDEESYGPPSLRFYTELIDLLKEKNIAYNIVDKY